ncbi:hypothetical protein VH571_16085 [Frondihabitans sp. 4ASC-45]|uniref:hypothetical protein n=1 Tax=Frondihabitans sp. 4ASC-45 TaxID=3111636 RepID=UPI003C1797DE
MNAIRNQSARLRRTLGRRLGEEDGLASAAIVLPGVILLVFLALQIALWYLGSNVAQNAAVAAYSSARAYQSSGAAGRSSGAEIVNQTGGFLNSPNVQVDRGATTVTITVTGQAVSLIPGVSMPEVRRTMTGPIERWVPAP